MNLAVLAGLPFLGAILVAITSRWGRTANVIAAGGTTLFSLVFLLTKTSAVFAGEIEKEQISWVPELGMNANFFLDPLGFLFAGMILSIGFLVIIYGRYYLAESDPMARFFVFLMLFQGAMLGIVLSDNVLLLLVFWELTSLSSFLLIGFWRHLPEGRQGARMALAVTGGGGLCLIAGLVLLGQIVGSYDLSVILSQKDKVQSSTLYLPTLILILLGCFTKSAQFPFHFWLPHAMAAPTPVSAYLHSATMVKAGIFLLARLWPVLAGTDAWFYIVATTGLVTMLVGAFFALFRDDLKALLAYSTISHLGLLTMLFGMGTKLAVLAGLFHIINHATFKAALFMNAGIVDHEAGTRDIRKLGGLYQLMPIAGTLGIIAAASMAGLPPFNGFLSKEMMLEEVAHTSWGGAGWLFPLLATLAAILSVAYSLRYIFHVYLGARREGAPKEPHDAPFGLWAPSSVLVVLVIAIGLFPGTLAQPFLHLVAGATVGGEVPPVALSLWHGVTPALWMSVVAVVCGAMLFTRHRSMEAVVSRLPAFSAKGVFDAAVSWLVLWSRQLTLLVHNGSLQRSLATLFGVAVVLALLAMGEEQTSAGLRETISAPPLAILAWFALLAASVAVLYASSRHRYISLVFISVVGLMVSLFFVYLSAPDLALTQISVETVTILLLLIALNLLPKRALAISERTRRLRDALLGLCAGGGTGYLAWLVMTRNPGDSISAFHWENSYVGGGGKNVVNVTLVDFRAFDTFGEIMVLGIAALTIFALLENVARGVAGQHLANWKPELIGSPERHPMMLVVATRLLLPLSVVAGLYIFLRGHNQPGGGFVAGLVVSIGVLMQYMASGFNWADNRRRIDHQDLIGWGVLVAAATGLGAIVFGVPLFTSAFGYFSLPVVGKFELATAMAFDLGVALTVIGAVMLALAALSDVAQRASKVKRVEHPMDVDPSRIGEDAR